MADDLLGAHIDLELAESTCLEMAKGGSEPLFCDARSDLKNFGDGKTKFLWKAQEELWGKLLPADSQREGTCVSRGTKNACEDSLCNAMVDGKTPRHLVRLAFESIYGGARIQVGKGRLGKKPGAYGCDAAMYVHRYGLNSRGVYGTIDLTGPREDMSVIWGSPGHGVPSVLITDAANYKVQQCMRCESTDDIRDAIAAGYGVAFCCNVLWQIPDGRSTQRDANGMCRPVTSGGHCEEVRGIFTDYKGRDCFVRQNSWGNYPRGGRLKLQDGSEVELPEGAYGCFESDMADAFRSGAEAWAFGIPKSPWRPANLKPSEV